MDARPGVTCCAYLKNKTRYEVLCDFEGYKKGDEVRLMSCTLSVIPAAGIETVVLVLPERDLQIDESADFVSQPQLYLKELGPLDWSSALKEYKERIKKQSKPPTHLP